MSALKTQVSGDHYKGMAIQPVEFIHSNGIGYFEGNVIKYVSRWRSKGGIADLEKAKHYIDLLIELENKSNQSDNESNDDCWIEWHGGECPVPNGTAVVVRFRDGWTSSETNPCNAPERMRWSHLGNYCDIIAYRVVKE